MSETEIRNATISRVVLGREDHGILTLWVFLDGHGWGVGYGGYAMDQWDPVADKRVGGYGYNFLTDCILGLLNTFEVESLDKLNGLPCRAEVEGPGGRCKRIGHFLKWQWFNFQELADRLKVPARR